MARRSQCSSAGDNPLDPNYLPPHYREEYRLAINALIEADLEGYYGFLQEANVVDFLSQTEIEYIKCLVQGPRQTAQPDRKYMIEDGDGSSDTYWPMQSELDAPGLDLGWPQQHRFVGPTEITTLVNPSDPNMASIKEEVRRMIKNAQQVVAVVMDMFTDVDIFADLLNAAMRRVAVYLLLDELNAHHFVSMVNNCRVNLDMIKFLRVRTVSGRTYFCHTGKSFKGQMMNRFMLVDCRVVLSGNYSFMWSFEKIHRCLAHVFIGELVTTFDEEFRILYAQSEPLVVENPITFVEDYGNFPGRHNIDNSHITKREYSLIEDMHTEGPRHSFDAHMDVLPFKRGESICSSTEGHHPLPVHATQQFRGEHSWLDQIRVKGPNTKEVSGFKRHGHRRGEHYIKGMENQGTHFPVEQCFSQRPGLELDYEIYGKSKDHSYHQFPGPVYPCEMGDMEPPSDYDHVQRYLTTYPALDTELAGNLLEPVQSLSMAHSMGQNYTYQTPPRLPNLPEQKHFFNAHHKQQEQKEGLRDWRINSYLTALQHSGHKDMVDLQRTDSCDNFPYVMKERLYEPEISENLKDEREFTKTSMSNFNPLPFQPPENSLDCPEDGLSNAKPKLPTTSELSSTTEVDKLDDAQKTEAKETNLTQEEFFRKRLNPALQRGSRLRHSLIFHSNLKQHIPEDIRNVNLLSQEDKGDSLKHSAVISNITEVKRPVTREHFQLSNLGSSLESAVSSNVEKTSMGDENFQKDAQQERSTCQNVQPQGTLKGNSQIKRLPSAVLHIDMNDPECRLRYFKELAAKRKSELALANLPKPTKDKSSKEPGPTSEKLMPCDTAEEKEPNLQKTLKNSECLTGILPLSPQKSLVCTSENSQSSNTITSGSQSLLGKHIKHTLSTDSKITSAPKYDSSCSDIPVSATDNEKIKLKQKLTEDCDSSSNTVQDKCVPAANPGLELRAKPKPKSHVNPISQFIAGQTDQGASSSPSVLSPKNSELRPADFVSLEGGTSANILPKTSTIEPYSTDFPAELLTASPAENPTPSLHPIAAEVALSLQTDVTETGPTTNPIPSETGPYQQCTPAETEHAEQTNTSQDTIAQNTCLSQSSTEIHTDSSQQTSTPKHLSGSSFHLTASEPSLLQKNCNTPATDESQLSTTNLTDTIPAQTSPETTLLSNVTVVESDTSQHVTATETGFIPDSCTTKHCSVSNLTFPANTNSDLIQNKAVLPTKEDKSSCNLASELSPLLKTESSETKSPHSSTPLQTALAVSVVSLENSVASPTENDKMPSTEHSSEETSPCVKMTSPIQDTQEDESCQNTTKTDVTNTTKTGDSTFQNVSLINTCLITDHKSKESKDEDQNREPTIEQTQDAQNKESGETHLVPEDFFQRRQNLALQRSSRLRHSLIFNSSLKQHIPEDITNSNSLSQEDKGDSLKHSVVISNITEEKRPVTRKHFQLSNLEKSFCDPSLDSAVSSNKEKTFSEDTNEITQNVQKNAQQEKRPSQTVQPQDLLERNSQKTQLPSTVIDMNDPECRLRYFKELAAKRKSELALANLPKPTKDKSSKEPGPKSEKLMPCDTTEEKELNLQKTLKNSECPTGILPLSPQKSLVCTSENSQSSNTITSGSQSLLGKHIKHTLSTDSKITSAPKYDSSCSDIPVSATDNEKIKLKQKLTEDCDSSSNTVQDKCVPAANPGLELSAKPKSHVNPISQFIAGQTDQGASSSPSVLSPKKSELRPADFVSSEGGTSANILPKTSTIEPYSTDFPAELLTASPAENPTPSLHPIAAEVALSLQTGVTETGPTTNPIPSETGPYQQCTPAETEHAEQTNTSQDTIAQNTCLSQSSTEIHTGSSQQTSTPKHLSGSSFHLTASEPSLLQKKQTLDTAGEIVPGTSPISNPQTFVSSSKPEPLDCNTLATGESQLSTTNLTDTIPAQTSPETTLLSNVTVVESDTSQHATATETGFIPDSCTTKNCSVSNLTSPANTNSDLIQNNATLPTNTMQEDKSCCNLASDLPPLLKTESSETKSPHSSTPLQTALAVLSENSVASPTENDKMPSTEHSTEETSPCVKMTSPIQDTQEDESCQNTTKTDVTNTSETDKQIINTCSITDHSQTDQFTDCASPECSSAPHSIHKESTADPDEDRTESSLPVNKSFVSQPLNGSNSSSLLNMPLEMYNLNQSSSKVCQPQNLILNEIETVQDITHSGSHLPSKSKEEICCPQDPKSEESKDVDQESKLTMEQLQQQEESTDTRMQVTEETPVDKIDQSKEITADEENAGPNISTKKSECCLTPCTESVNQQSRAEDKPVVYQYSTANALSCSNLRDDTKVLLEQISAKNQIKASKMSVGGISDTKEDKANSNTKADKQTSRYLHSKTQTWSSKASPQEREKLLKRMESLRKEKKVYSRFEEP